MIVADRFLCATQSTVGICGGEIITLAVLRSVGLLSMPYSMLARASVAHFVRSALRDKNLYIIRANHL